MLVNPPNNEEAILPKLPKESRDQYLTLKKNMENAAIKMEAAAKRNNAPDIDTAIFTRQLELGLDAARDKQEVLMGDYERTERTAKWAAINNRSLQTFQAEYPESTTSTDPEKIAQAKRNQEATQALDREVNGEGLIASGVKSFYDEDKEGVQWSRIGGMLLGGAGAFALGSYIVSAAGAGAGWLGAIAIALLTITGIVFGGNIMHSLFNPGTAPGTQDGNEHGQSQGKSPACGLAPAQPEYTFKPPHTDVLSAGRDTHYLKLAQHGDAPPSLVNHNPQMTLEGHYVDKDGVRMFKLRNAVIHTEHGNQRLGAGGLYLHVEKDNSIRLNSPQNIEAFEKLDTLVKAENNRLLGEILQNSKDKETTQGKASIRRHEAVSAADILKPSVVPDIRDNTPSGNTPGC